MIGCNYGIWDALFYAQELSRIISGSAGVPATAGHSYIVETVQ